MDSPVVLYVEDEDAAYVLFKTALAAAEIDVHLVRATDGEQALQLLNGNGSPKPDLVILDLNLPRKTGLDVLEEIGHDHGLKRLPIVVFSSSALAADRRRSLDLGARAYVTKPFTYEGFVEAVRQVCSYLPASKVNR